MIQTTEPLNLWEAADALGIETWRLSRLGRYLNIDPADKCVPREEIDRIAEEEAVDDRYGALRRWVLTAIRQKNAV